MSNQISEEDFQFICSLVRDQAAIIFEPNKKYLVEARLMMLKKKMQYESLGQIISTLKTETNGKCLQGLVNIMTTNETSFFRDAHIFELIKKHIIPTVMENKKNDKTINIWNCACSSGQEPFSLLMMLKENFPLLFHDWKLNVLATDISTDILEKAKSGRFVQLEVNRGLPAQLLIKYFQNKNNEWIFSEELRNCISFEEFNLCKSWKIMPQMDLIFLRNVLIYFDAEVKTTILEKMRKVIAPNGYLFLGASETLINIEVPFERKTVEGGHCYIPV